MSNRLIRLAQRLRDLPQQKKLDAQFNQLQSIAEEVQKCLIQVGAARTQAKALRAVEPSSSLDVVVDRQMAIVRKCTGSLIKATQSSQVLENAEISAPLQDVRVAGRALQEATTKEWKRVSSADQEEANAFWDIAKQYDAVAANRLQVAMAHFSDLTATPPTSVAEIDRYKAARKDMLKARDDLNLDGSKGGFLKACMGENGADPKDLEKPEVRAFLDQHPILWKRLRLRLT